MGGCLVLWGVGSRGGGGGGGELGSLKLFLNCMNIFARVSFLSFSDK